MLSAKPPPVMSATAVLRARWSRNRVASAGANSEPSICSTIEAETIRPAVPPSTPRSRRIGASQAKTLKDIMACRTMNPVTCQATAERQTLTPPAGRAAPPGRARSAGGRNSRRTTPAGSAQNQSAAVHCPARAEDREREAGTERGRGADRRGVEAAHEAQAMREVTLDDARQQHVAERNRGAARGGSGEQSRKMAGRRQLHGPQQQPGREHRHGTEQHPFGPEPACQPRGERGEHTRAASPGRW